MQADHIVPVSAGGMYTPENIVSACQKCNLKKGSKSLLTMTARLGPNMNWSSKQQRRLVRARASKQQRLERVEAWQRTREKGGAPRRFSVRLMSCGLSVHPYILRGLDEGRAATGESRSAFCNRILAEMFGMDLNAVS